MQNNTLFVLFLFSLLLVSLPTWSTAAGISTVQGRIVSDNQQNRDAGKGSFVRHILRIKQIGDIKNNIPSLFTAEILVESGSLESEIIRVAKDKGNLCQFSLSRRGMRYFIHAIYLLEGAGFGRDIIPTAPGNNISISGNAVYHDQKNKIIINNNETVEKGFVHGNSGISIGGH